MWEQKTSLPEKGPLGHKRQIESLLSHDKNLFASRILHGSKYATLVGNKTRDAGIGRTHDRHTIFDRAKDRGLQMLKRRARLSEPGIVRDHNKDF